MKFLMTFVIILASLFTIKSQSIEINLITTPCNHDGVFNVDLDNFTFPAYVTVYYNNKQKYDTLLSDIPIVISDFGGGIVYVNAFNSVSITTFKDLPHPFDVTYTTTNGVCPQKGSALANIVGGTPPFDHKWYTYQDVLVGQGNPIDLDNGGYYSVITDAAGCVYDAIKEGRDSTNIFITVDPGFTYDVTTTEANCTNGSAKISNIVGGLPPFSYDWSDGTNSNEITNRSTGYYNVNVIDANGCISSKYEVFIKQSKEIKVKFVQTPESCNNADGKLQVFPEGGKPPYTYQWYNISNNMSNTITNVSEGYYNVTCVDSEGCIGQGGTNLPSFSPVYVQISNIKYSNCNQHDGAATLIPQGGTPPYTVLWHHNNSTNFAQENLSEGVYSFTVKDNTGCRRTGNVPIQSTPTIYTNFIVIKPTCDLPNGSIKVTAQGGSQPYSFKWNNGSNDQTLTFASKGYYTVTITDSNGCSVAKSINLDAVSPLSINFNVKNASCLFTPDGEITATILDGTAPYTYNWNVSNGQNTSSISSLKTGKYYLSVKDANGCIGNDMTFVDYDQSNDDCYCTLKGKVYHDVDNDCVLDNNEAGIENIQIGIDNFGYTYSNSIGNYSFLVPSGNYRLRESVRNQYPLANCVSSFYDFTSNAGPSCTIEYNIPHSITPLHDMVIQLWNKDHAVAGYEYNQQLVVTNMGTVPEQAIIGRHRTDIQTPILNVSPNMLSILSNQNYNTVNLPTLLPGQSQAIDINYPVSPTIPLGSELIFYDSCAYMAPITNWQTDYSPVDNVLIKRETVVGSYDPNFIEVMPQGAGQQGYISKDHKSMSYMVHFQNEGTWYARRVEVVVDIDPNIDIKSIVPLTESHVVKSISINNDRQLIYVFDNINLQPKSWNEALSQGMFSFQCKLINGLNEGSKISNQANIFFDFNQPIATNKTLNTIEFKSDNNETFENKITITPNPASTIISLEGESKQDVNEYLFYNITGHLISQQKSNTVDISSWQPGTYIVKSISNGKQEIGKFIKY